MNKTIYALGFFDGVHLGHAELLKHCRQLAGQNGCSAGVVTFDIHPETLVQGKAPELINTSVDRTWLLYHRFAMDHVLTLPFDRQLRAMPWQDFLDMLVRERDAVGFVCGEDFRFGHMGRGNAELLRQYCREHGLHCAVVMDQMMDGMRISSTYIRRQLQTGDMATAVRFLGHPYILSGEIIPGKQLGRKLGIPTANMLLPQGLAVLKHGVYACRVQLEGRSYPAVTNVGVRPTVSGTGVNVETWILDYSGDLYGQRITLEFFHYIRPEQKFPSLEALKQAVQEDARQTRQILEALS